jgi:hypothetical protein
MDTSGCETQSIKFIGKRNFKSDEFLEIISKKYDKKSIFSTTNKYFCRCLTVDDNFEIDNTLRHLSNTSLEDNIKERTEVRP